MSAGRRRPTGSTVILGWIKEHGPVTPREYAVLRELGEHAGQHERTSSGGPGDIAYCYPGIDTIAGPQASRYDRKQVMRALENLERYGYILVCRPETRGRGRHNQYVILLGRDPRETASRLGWPPPKWSPSGTIPDSPSSDASPQARDVDDRPDPAPDDQSSHRAAQAAPPATTSERPTEAVDDDVDQIRRKVPRGDHYDEGMVPNRSPNGVPQGPEVGRGSSPPTSQLAVALDTQGGSASGPVDEADSSLVHQLRAAIERRLAALTPPVTAVSATWDLTPAQLLELNVHAAAWPTADEAIAALADATVEAVQHYGVVPRSARAWRTTWVETHPPEPMPGEPLCTEHAIPGYDMPIRICAECRQRDVAGMVAQ